MRVRHLPLFVCSFMTALLLSSAARAEGAVATPNNVLTGGWLEFGAGVGSTGVDPAIGATLGGSLAFHHLLVSGTWVGSEQVQLFGSPKSRAMWFGLSAGVVDDLGPFRLSLTGGLADARWHVSESDGNMLSVPFEATIALLRGMAAGGLRLRLDVMPFGTHQDLGRVAGLVMFVGQVGIW